MVFFWNLDIKKCAWCSSYKISFLNGHEGPRGWKYSNKDGSRDKRRKDNYEEATYNSEHKCNECNASSIYEHAKSKSPGPNKNILIRQLLKDGEGERSGSDFKAKWLSKIWTLVHVGL